MGDTVLAGIVHDLVETIGASVSIDWTQKTGKMAPLPTRLSARPARSGHGDQTMRHYPPSSSID